MEIILAIQNYDELLFNEVHNIVDYYQENMEWQTQKPEEQLDMYHKIIESQNKSSIMGCFDSKEHVEKQIKQYISFINDPQNLEKRSYIFHSKHREEWKEEKYKLFQKGLQQYIHLPINNKKIASYIGSNIDPNHVKHIKGPYLRALRKRAKSSNITLKQQLEQDIENFDISLFTNARMEKLNKKMEKVKRKGVQSNIDLRENYIDDDNQSEISEEDDPQEELDLDN